MNTHRTVEKALLVVLLATVVHAVWNSTGTLHSRIAGQLPRQEQIVQSISRQTEESRLPFLLVVIPVTVLQLLLQD